MLSDVKGKTYEEKLKDTGLTTLKERRVRGDLIETFKVMKGMNRTDKNKWFVIRSQNTTRTTQSTTSVSDEGEVKRDDVMFKEHVRLDVRKNFFCERVVNQWNALPDIVRNQETTNAFKNQYDNWMKRKE